MRGKQLDLLSVEDDPDIRHVLQLALAMDGGITLHQAVSADEAWAMLQAGLRPDLILLDDRMPETSGVQLACRIRDTYGDATMPIAFLTAASSPGDMERFERAGAIGVIFKPFDAPNLTDEIREMLTGGTKFYLSI